jgi:tetratricopeptide (TPR) repeat protein
MVLWLVVATTVSSVGCNMAATGQNMQGVRMYEQGQYYPAIERFQKAMATAPHDANSYYNMAATVHRLGTANKDPQAWQQAEALYNQCLDRDPDHAACHRALAVLLVETDRSDRAFTLLRNWAIRSPQNADARVELARLHQEFGDGKTAELQLQQALQLDQTNRRAWTALAHLRETKGDYQQAMANYQRALTLNSHDPAVAGRIAALNRASSGTAPGTITADGSTRTVNVPTPAARY